MVLTFSKEKFLGEGTQSPIGTADSLVKLFRFYATHDYEGTTALALRSETAITVYQKPPLKSDPNVIDVTSEEVLPEELETFAKSFPDHMIVVSLLGFS